MTWIERGRSAVAWFDRSAGGVSERRRVLVLERATSAEWRAVLGEIGGERPTVIDARHVEIGPGGVAGHSQVLHQLAAGAEVHLVVKSSRSVCRFIEAAEAPPDLLRRMVALRLETELPYPVSESTWVCERQESANNGAGQVLVIAASNADIAEAEEVLRASGLRCHGVEHGAAGLAELAVSENDGEQEASAIVALDPGSASLAVIHGGVLCYARTLSATPPAEAAAPSSNGGVGRIANELSQSLYDYVLRTGRPRPNRLLVAGEGIFANGLIETLSEHLGMPVELARAPVGLEVAPASLYADDVVGESPSCIGALIALHRRARGDHAAAPALRTRARGFSLSGLPGRRALLIGINVLLVITLVASLFGVRAAQIASADKVIEESQSLVNGLEAVREEVSILQRESRQQRSVLDALSALADALPSGVEVESLRLNDKGLLTISGRTKSVEAVDDKAVNALNESPMFANVKFLGATKQKNGFGFRIECELRAAGGGNAS